MIDDGSSGRRGRGHDMVDIARRRTGAALLGIVLVTALVHLTSFREGHDWGGDFAFYIHQAKALVEGDLARLSAMAAHRLEYSTTDIQVAPAFYPWGFPLLLSPVYAFFGQDLLPMKVMVLFFAVAAQAMVFFLLRGRLADRWVLLIVFIMGINPFLFGSKNQVASDFPFFYMVLLSLLLMQRIVIDGRRFLGSTPNHLMLGLAILGAYLIRSHGLALVPTLAGLQIFNAWDKGEPIGLGAASRAVRRLRPVSCLPYLVLFAGAGAMSLAFSNANSSYLASVGFAYGDLTGFLTTIVYNVVYYGWLPSVFLDMDKFGQVLNVAILMPLALLGVCRRYRRDFLLLIYTAIHMAILVLYPFNQGVRFILPVMPIYLYFAVVGAMEARALLADRLSLPKRIPNPAVLIFLPLAIYLAANVSVRWAALAGKPGVVLEGPYQAASLDMFECVRGATPETAIIVFWKPRVLTFYTGRRAIVSVAPEEILDGRSDYLLIHKANSSLRINERLRAAVAAYPDRFAPVHRNSDFRLYRILGEAAAPGRETAAC